MLPCSSCERSSQIEEEPKREEPPSPAKLEEEPENTGVSASRWQLCRSHRIRADDWVVVSSFEGELPADIVHIEAEASAAYAKEQAAKAAGSAKHDEL